jgi:hypothetical protein
MENYYKTADYERLFHYFFEVYAIALTKGVATDDFLFVKQQYPYLEIDNGNIVAKYLDRGLSLLREGYTPTVISLFLENLYVEYSQGKISTEQMQMINLARSLIKSLHTFNLQTLLDMSGLWTDDTKAYADTYFYPKLPQNIKDEYCRPPSAVAQVVGPISFRKKQA